MSLLGSKLELIRFLNSFWDFSQCHFCSIFHCDNALSNAIFRIGLSFKNELSSLTLVVLGDNKMSLYSLKNWNREIDKAIECWSSWYFCLDRTELWNYDRESCSRKTWKMQKSPRKTDNKFASCFCHNRNAISQKKPQYSVLDFANKMSKLRWC